MPIAVPGSAVSAVGDRGHCQRSQLSPLPSWLPVLSLPLQYTLPWCQLKTKLEQPAFPQLLPRAGFPWDEVLALSLDLLRSLPLAWSQPSPHLSPCAVCTCASFLSKLVLLFLHVLLGRFPLLPLPIHAEGQSWQL